MMSSRWIYLGAALLLSPLALAVTLTNNGQRLEETLTLTADIDLTESMIEPLEVISHSAPFQNVRWDPITSKFSDLDVSLRALGTHNRQPLLLDILNDSYSCASTSPVAESQIAFSAVNEGYVYHVLVQGKEVTNLVSGGKRRHQFTTDQWQLSELISGVQAGKYLLDFSLRVELPVPGNRVPSNTRAPVICDGQLTLMVSIPIAPAS